MSNEAGRALRVLLVEDDLDVAAALGDFLTAAGLEIDYAADGRQAAHCLQQARFDALVLDVNLPDADGFSLCREWRERFALRIPVLFLTARADLQDRLAGFAAGGVDYLLKPVAPEELLARIRALCRYFASSAEPVQTLQCGAFQLDIGQALLRRGDQAVHVSAIPLQILQCLMRASPQLVRTGELSAVLWGDDVPDSDPLRAHVHQLRRQLRAHFACDPLQTVRGYGYRFDEQAISDETA